MEVDARSNEFRLQGEQQGALQVAFLDKRSRKMKRALMRRRAVRVSSWKNS